MADRNIVLKPGLYVTATPIGNLGDITYRAVEAMKAADEILCEDTRTTATLCKAYNISTPRRAYQDHNGHAVRPAIIEQLQAGATFCLVSDAGTPLISDPGFKLVRDARAAGIDVYPLPGASAAIAALSAAGAPSDQFFFAGFIPAKQAARKRAFEALAQIPATLICYENGRRLAATLCDMHEAFGDRDACVAREITKFYEEFKVAPLATLAIDIAETPIKGEIVVLVWPAPELPTSQADLDAFLVDILKDKRVSEAADAAAQTLGVKRRDAYTRALALKKRTD